MYVYIYIYYRRTRAVKGDIGIRGRRSYCWLDCVGRKRVVLSELHGLHSARGQTSFDFSTSYCRPPSHYRVFFFKRIIIF